MEEKLELENDDKIKDELEKSTALFHETKYHLIDEPNNDYLE